MFDRIFDFITMIAHWFIFWTVIDPFEQAVVIQVGTFRRVLTGGIWLVCPFGIDTVTKETVVRQTAYLDVQSLTSKDGKPVAIAAIVVFRITDIKKFLLDIDEGETDMTNIVYGIVSDCVEATAWQNIRGKLFNADVYETARRDCDEYCGVKILAIKWSDKATARSIRLWND